MFWHILHFLVVVIQTVSANRKRLIAAGNSLLLLPVLKDGSPVQDRLNCSSQHGAPAWDRKDVIIEQGKNLTIKCLISGISFFDVLRVSHMQGTKSVTLSDNDDIKQPFSQLQRYQIFYDFSHNDVATISVSIIGIRGEDSCTLGCRNLAWKNTMATVNIDVLVPVNELYIVTISSNQTETRISDGNFVYLKQMEHLGVGCVATVDGSQILPKLEVTIGGKDVNADFNFESNKEPVTSQSSLLSYQSVAKRTLFTNKPNPDFNEKILRCTALQTGFDPVVTSAFLNVQFAPDLKCDRTLYEARVGDNVTITCNLQTNPESQIKWTSVSKDKNHRLNPEKDKHFAFDNRTTKGDSSQLLMTITRVKESHFGTYSVSARNEIGADSVNVVLVKISSPAPGPKVPGPRTVPTKKPPVPNAQNARRSQNHLSTVTVSSALLFTVLFTRWL